MAKETLTVFAASSLTEAFRDLEGEFERANPNWDLRFSFAGSQILRLQIEQGARADVLRHRLGPLVRFAVAGFGSQQS